MKYSKNVDKYRIQISARKYIEVKHEELLLLRQILLHETINSFILHDLFKGLVNSSFSSTTISNRIRKFVEYDILVRIEESFTINHFIQTKYYYKLGENGYQLLTEFFFLDPYSLHSLEEDVQTQCVPTVNEIALSTLANDIYLNSIRSDYNFQYAKFKDHWLSISRNTIGNKIFSNAWVFESETQLIVLILNATIHSSSHMTGIFNNVLNPFARELVQEEKHCIVIFSVTEQFRNVYTNIKTTNTRDIIYALKAWMPYFTQWHPNLEVYVLAFDRVKERIESLLRFVEVEAGYKYLLPRNLRHYLEQKKEEDFLQCFLPINAFSEKNKIGFQTFHFLRYQDDTRNIISIAALEGSVKTHQTIASLEKQLFNKGYSYEKAPIHLIVIYPNQTNQDNDIIHSSYGRNLWITNFQHMNMLANEPIRNLKFNHLVGLQKRKNLLFYL